ncbi:MAG: hypothetical protein KIS92_04300 [Planctomycetota bacterium]|nr:hypothetical protein [Planctomycetota bacterium]
MMTVQPILRQTFHTAELFAKHPPRLTHPNKRVLFALTCPPDAVHAGELRVSRWQPGTLPADLPAGDPLAVQSREGYFDYAPSQYPQEVPWHLNFADLNLFAFYGGRPFAQDEMQVAEHPGLAAVREALLHAEQKVLTSENYAPTPFLVMGVERRCAVATEPNAAEGRPNGLYGRAFAAATPEAVRRATRLLVPPTRSNILAIEASSYGSGAYTREQIALILRTAATGFAAARQESHEAFGAEAEPVIHTGFWGCGAFGGNRVLMTLLQIAAARAAGIRRVVFHLGDAQGAGPFAKARKLWDGPIGACRRTDDLIAKVEALGLEWGVSDGN